MNPEQNIREKGPQAEITEDSLAKLFPQKSEVTVGRKLNKKTGEYEFLESGWVVSGYGKTKDGKLAVTTEDPTQTKKGSTKKGIYKIFEVSELIGFQDFKDGDEVPVLVAKKPGENPVLETKGWSILNRLEDGSFSLIKTNEQGLFLNDDQLTKAELIRAQMATLGLERKGIEMTADAMTPEDRDLLKKIDSKLAYWEKKLKVSEEFERLK